MCHFDRFKRLVVALFCVLATESHAQDWPQWRGPEANNHAAKTAKAALRWNFSSGENIAWKTKIPGRGHSTPIVVGDAIFLTTAEHDQQTQSVLKISRTDGRVLDQWTLHRGTLPASIHSNNSHASPSPAFDGERVLVSFHTDDAIVLTALSPDGQQLWENRVSDFRPSRFQFGYGASPIVEDGLVIVAAEYDGPSSGIYALDTRSGRQVWKIPRPQNLNFATPIIATIAGQRMLLIAGAEMINAYDPTSGRELWRVDTTTEAICGTICWDGRSVLISGGNPVSGTWCVSGDGTRKELWDNRVKCYEQSMLTVPGYAFALSDNGIAYCFKTTDGTEMWKKRISGGGVSASPVLVGKKLYFADQSGMVYVIQGNPHRFDLLSEIKTGDSIFASPVPVDDRLLIRTGVGVGRARQEYLVAIGGQ